MRGNQKALIRILEELTLELIKTKVHIKFDNSFYYDNQNNFISIMLNLDTDEEEKIVNNYFKNKLNIKTLNSVTIAFIHELGHYWSRKVYKLNKEFYKESAENRSVINSFYDTGVFSYEEALNQYYQIPVEKLANDFLILVYENEKTRKIVEKYDNRISHFYPQLNAD